MNVHMMMMPKTGRATRCWCGGEFVFSQRRADGYLLTPYLPQRLIISRLDYGRAGFDLAHFETGIATRDAASLLGETDIIADKWDDDMLSNDIYFTDTAADLL